MEPSAAINAFIPIQTTMDHEVEDVPGPPSTFRLLLHPRTLLPLIQKESCELFFWLTGS